LYAFLKFGKKFSQDFQINEMNALAWDKTWNYCSQNCISHC